MPLRRCFGYNKNCKSFLSLDKKTLNLNELIQNTISDFINQIRKTKHQQLPHQQHKDTLKIESLFKDDVFIYADEKSGLIR